MTEPPAVSYPEIHRQFLEIEDEFDLFSMRIGDCPVWECVRTPIMVDVVSGSLFSESGGSEPEVSIPGRSRATRLLRASVRYNPFFRRPRDVVSWGHNRRSKQNDGRYWDLYCDPLYEELDLDYIHLEVPHKGRHYRPSKTESLGYLDGIRFAGKLRGRLGRTGIPNEAERRLRAVEERIEETFGTPVDVVGTVRETVTDFRTTKPMYGRLLDWHDPSLVIVVVSYGKESFISACKDRSIPVVELQHGVVTRYHNGYSFPGERTKETFPDRFLAFGEYWNETVPYPEAATVEAVGYPYLEAEHERLSHLEPENRVVVISQHRFVGDRLSSLAVELAQQSGPDLEVVYKLHPEEYYDWTDRYPHLVDSSVRVAGKYDASLYRLFATARAQVGGNSTALFEGLRFGLSTYVLHGAGLGYVDDLIDTGQAQVVESARDVLADLGSSSRATPETERLFASEPIENIASVIADLDPE